jgi:hypothetical protein
MILTLALLAPMWNNKLVKSWSEYEREYIKTPSIKLKSGERANSPGRRLKLKTTAGSNSTDRKLPNENDENPDKLKIEPKETGLIFLAKVKAIVEERLMEELGVRSQITTDGYLFVRNGMNLLEVSFELLDDEEQKLQTVLIYLKNDVITMDLSIEKTKLKDYVQDYLFFYISNGVLSVRQTVLTTDDIYADLGSMIMYVCDEPRGEVDLVFTKYQGSDTGEGDKEERRLSLEEKDKIMENQLNAKPIYSAIKVFPLNLKNKKFISKKPGVMNYIRNLELPEIKAFQPRAERRLSGIPLYRKPGEIGFVHSKLGYFRDNTLQNKDNLKLSSDGHFHNDKKAITFKLFSSRPNLPDIDARLSILGGTNPAKLTFNTTSFYIEMEFSVVTLRFVLLHTRLALEEMVGYLQIIDHLNDLRVWRDFYPGYTKYHWRIHEFFQPALIQMMYREMFDNMTDGQTAQKDPEGKGSLQMHYFTSDTGDDLIWEFEVTTKNGKLLDNKIAFYTFGEDMETAYMTGELYSGSQGKSVNFGNREVPSESMFNQHFLLKKYMEMQVEFVIRSSIEFKDYKDDITPFITDAYKYSEYEEIPEVRNPDPGKPLEGYRYSTDRLGAKKLEVTVPGDKIEFQLCPVLSTEYHDTIQRTPRGYIFTGGRFYFRKDIDYCYKVSNPAEDNYARLAKLAKGGEGSEERRLKENVSGQLV